MTGLVYPDTPGGRAAAKDMRDIRAARTIQESSKFELSSDEFLAPKDIKEQLQRLANYAKAKSEIAPYRIPQPVGWRLQVLILQPPEKTSGGLELPSDVTEAYAHKAVQGIVLALGADAYKDTDRYPGGPWVAVGDRIQFKRYDTSQFELANGQKLGTLNDSQPIGIIDRGWNIPVEVM